MSPGASFARFRAAAAALAGLLAVFGTSASLAGPQEVQFLQNLEGQWSGQGRAATSDGEAAITCDVRGESRGAASVALRARCQAQGQSGSINVSLRFSEMTRSFHGELSSPLDYISGGLTGQLSRGDLFLRLAANDGSQGRLVLVAQGGQQMRLLVTTIVDGASITVFDLPLVRAS